MKKASLYFIVYSLMCFLLFTGKLNAQENDTASIIGFSPSSKITTINGLGFNYTILALKKRYADVNGIRLNVTPITIFMPFLTLLHAPIIKAGQIDNTFGYEDQNRINGINLTLFDPNSSKINGIEINISGGRGNTTNGFSTGLVNSHETINGLTFGILRNASNKCRGIQIGLVNECENMKGIQIGLWNKNSKRNFPLINWNF